MAAIEASLAGVSADSEGEMQKLRDELASLQAQAKAFADMGDRIKASEAKKAELNAEIERAKAAEGEGQKVASGEQSELQDALSEARSAAAKWDQELMMQGTAKTTLLEEVNSLKTEAKDLTDAHSREVERLQERQIQRLLLLHWHLHIAGGRCIFRLPPSRPGGRLRDLGRVARVVAVGAVFHPVAAHRHR